MDNAEARIELLKLLISIRDGISKLNKAQAHVKAENMLLGLLGDEEISKVWLQASAFWWYA